MAPNIPLPCNKHARQKPFNISQTGFHFDLYNVHCCLCGKNGPKRRSLHDAIKAWNKLLEDNRTLIRGCIENFIIAKQGAYIYKLPKNHNLERYAR